MGYDVLIGELYDVCREYGDQMTEENEKDIDFLRRVYALNFDVRKCGIKGLGIAESDVMEDDVRIVFDEIISLLASFSDECRFPHIGLHLEGIREELMSTGIDGLKPY